MAGLENLFVTEPELPQTQKTKLQEDLKLWPETLTTLLKERFPELAGLALEVEMRKKDEPSGTAIGVVHVISDEAQKSLYVPFIVKNFELCPMDVWMERVTQRTHPLTRDTFNKEFFLMESARELDARPADALGQYFNDPSMWTQTYPPLQGRYSYASAGYPILDQISDTIRADAVAELKQVFEQNPYLLAKFEKHGHLELIKTLTKKSFDKTAAVNEQDFAQSAMRLLPVGVALIKRESVDKYSLLSGADDTFDLSQSVPMMCSEMKSFLEKITPHVEDVLAEVDQEGEKMLIMGKPMEGVFLYDDMTDKPVLANNFSAYCIKNKSGISIEGMVLPNVVNFAGKKVPGKIFISRSHSGYQENIAGIPSPATDVALKVLKPSAVRVGQTGTFCFVDDGKSVATVPVTIKAVDKSCGDSVIAITLEGRKIRINMTYSDGPMMASDLPSTRKDPKYLDAHGMVEKRPDEYIIPRRMMWIPMQGFTELSSSAADWMAKEASLHMTPDPLVVRYTGIVYDFRGNGLGQHEFNEKQASVALATLGASEQKIAQILKKARHSGKTEVHGLKKMRKKADIIKIATETYSQLTKIASQLKVNLVKEAADIDESATVDVLLSLNFLNPENIAKFVSYRPGLEQCADHLSELLLAARLGEKDIRESSALIGMTKLLEVIEGLKKLESTVKGLGGKLASAKAPVIKRNQAPVSQAQAS